MSGVIADGNLPALVRPGVDKIIMQYKPYSSEWSEIFTTSSEDKMPYIEDVMVSNFGLPQVKPEGEATKFQSISQAFRWRYRFKTYSTGYIVTMEQAQDNMYINLVDKNTKLLAKSLDDNKNTIAADILNNAFDSDFQMEAGDGQPLCSASHPLEGSGGGTYSNVLGATVSAELSETAIEDASIAISRYQDGSGNIIAARPEMLIVRPEDEFEAIRIMKSERQNDTANNAINALRVSGIFRKGILVNHFLDSAAWFIKTDIEGLRHVVRMAPKYTVDNDTNTDNAKVKVVERFVFGWSNPRSIFGVLPA